MIPTSFYTPHGAWLAEGCFYGILSWMGILLFAYAYWMNTVWPLYTNSIFMYVCLLYASVEAFISVGQENTNPIKRTKYMLIAVAVFWFAIVAQFGQGFVDCRHVGSSEADAIRAVKRASAAGYTYNAIRSAAGGVDYKSKSDGECWRVIDPSGLVVALDLFLVLVPIVAGVILARIIVSELARLDTILTIETRENKAINLAARWMYSAFARDKRADDTPAGKHLHIAQMEFHSIDDIKNKFIAEYGVKDPHPLKKE